MKPLSHLFRITLLAALVAGTALSARPVPSAQAQGATFIVNTQNDDDPPLDDDYCSLREAITNANDDFMTYDDCLGPGLGADTILFAADPSSFTYFPLNADLPQITDPAGLMIYGAGVVALNGQNRHRLFYVDHARLTLASIHLDNGNAFYSGFSDAGGGVYNEDGTLTVIDSVIYNNQASTGGAIFNQSGNLTVTNSFFLENIAYNLSAGGGALFLQGTVILRNNTFKRNSAPYAGDLYVTSGSTTLENNLFANSQSGGHCNLRSTNTRIWGHNNLFQDGSTACGFRSDSGFDNLVGVDPMFHTDFYGIALQSTSPAIGAGDDAACAAVPANNTSLNGLVRPQGIHCDIGAYEFPQAPISDQKLIPSSATEDGWVLESSETSNLGGTKNNTATTLPIGDNAANKQYRAVLSFDTSALPDDAVISSVTLKFRYAGKSGTLPFSTHGNLLVDLLNGAFRDNPALQLGDFNAKGISSNYKSAALSFSSGDKDSSSGLYSKSFSATDFSLINKTGRTQVRLRYTRDDNNDLGADLLKIYSGNSTMPPVLLIFYTYYDR